MNQTPPSSPSAPSLPRQRTLLQQFVFSLLLPLVAAFLLAAGGTVLVSYKFQQEHENSSRSQVLRLYERSLKKPLWDCDSDTVSGIVDTLAHMPEVAGVRLQDVCADKTITAGSVTDLPGTAADRLQLPMVHHDEFGRSFSVGHLDVRFHSASFTTAALNALWRYAAIFAVMLVVVFAGAALIFRKIIGKPLERFLSAIHAHQRVDLPSNATADARARHAEDELTEVMHAYNTLVDTNAEQTSALAKAVSKLLQNERKLIHTARHDPLTGLSNRLALQEALDSAIARAKRSGQGGHVLLLDLNKFKPINDQYGHAAGDEVLKAVALRLQASVRNTDTVARLGGDEFVVVVEGPSSAAGLATLSQTIKTAIAQPILLGDVALSVHASIGAASFPQDSQDSSSLLAHADRAMYANKSADKSAAR